MMNMIKQTEARCVYVVLLSLFLLLFSGCEEIDSEDFIKFSKGTYSTKLVTSREGTRNIDVEILDGGTKYPILELLLNVDGKRVIRSRYNISEKVRVQKNGRVEISFSSRTRGSGFLRIEGEEFLLGDVHFIVKQNQSSSKLSIGIEKLVFLKTGFTPTPLKKKHTLIF